MLNRSAPIMAATAVGVLVAQTSVASAQEEIPVLESLPEHLLYTVNGVGEPVGAGQIVDPSRAWEPGRTIRVCFMGGGQSVRRLISTVASEWSDFANIKFDFGVAPNYRGCFDQDGFSQIKISFTSPGYFSLVGVDSEQLANPYQPSMNFFRFDQIYNPISFPPGTVVTQANPSDKATILHEFGHALGLLHEHQHPDLKCWEKIRFDGPGNVYDYLSQPPNGWNRQMVDYNLRPIKVFTVDPIAGPDRESIMFYSLPANIFTEGANSTCHVKRNTKLSSRDKLAIARLYQRASLRTSASELSISESALLIKSDFIDSGAVSGIA